MKELEELKEIIKEFTRALPGCQNGCGRPATRQANTSCSECGLFGELYCDKCDLPFPNQFRVTWIEIPSSNMARKITKALKL